MQSSPLFHWSCSTTLNELLKRDDKSIQETCACDCMSMHVSKGLVLNFVKQSVTICFQFPFEFSAPVESARCVDTEAVRTGAESKWMKSDLKSDHLSAKVFKCQPNVKPGLFKAKMFKLSWTELDALLELGSNTGQTIYVWYICSRSRPALAGFWASALTPRLRRTL